MQNARNNWNNPFIRRGVIRLILIFFLVLMALTIGLLRASAQGQDEDDCPRVTSALTTTILQIDGEDVAVTYMLEPLGSPVYGQIITELDWLAVHEEPDGNGELVGRVYPQSLVRVSGKSAGDADYYVHIDNGSGWVSAENLSICTDYAARLPYFTDQGYTQPSPDEPAQLIVATPVFQVTPQEEQQDQGITGTTVRITHMYPQPYALQVLQVIPTDTTVEVNARNLTGDFLYVRYDGIEGWVYRSRINQDDRDYYDLPFRIGETTYPISETVMRIGSNGLYLHSDPAGSAVRTETLVNTAARVLLQTETEDGYTWMFLSAEQNGQTIEGWAMLSRNLREAVDLREVSAVPYELVDPEN